MLHNGRSKHLIMAVHVFFKVMMYDDDSYCFDTLMITPDTYIGDHDACNALEEYSDSLSIEEEDVWPKVQGLYVAKVPMSTDLTDGDYFKFPRTATLEYFPIDEGVHSPVKQDSTTYLLDEDQEDIASESEDDSYIYEDVDPWMDASPEFD